MLWKTLFSISSAYPGLVPTYSMSVCTVFSPPVHVVIEEKRRGRR